MLKNFFLTALRQFRRNKWFTLINVLGLAIGICASLVIFLIVQHDNSFDKHHKDGDRIYRVVSDFTFSGQPYNNSGVTTGLSKVADKEISGMETAAPFYLFDWDVKVTIPNGSDSAFGVFKKQGGIVFADDRFFKLFHSNWLAGSPMDAFSAPNKVVLTESRAKVYFPDIPADRVVGRSIVFSDTLHMTVAGIVADVPEKTDLGFQGFISLKTIEITGLSDLMQWGKWESTNGSSQLFVKLAAGSNEAGVKQQLNALLAKNTRKDPNGSRSFQLQPLKDIHFASNYSTDFAGHVASRKTLNGLMIVALFLLLLAAINFINLSTAQSTQRAREIGVRKTMGSSRRQLILQFLSETFLLALITTVLALVLLPYITKLFSGFTPPGLDTFIWNKPVFLGFAFLLIIVVSTLSGIYPALVLSRFRPVAVLKAQRTRDAGSGHTWLRKGLIVSQFVIAQFFIIATVLVGKQIHYSLNKDMGFKKDAIFTVDLLFFDKNSERSKQFFERMHSIPEIRMLSMGSRPPASNNTWSGEVHYNDGKNDISKDVNFKMGDSNYLKLYQIKLVAGRMPLQSDTVREFAINETYARELGFKNPAAAVGINLSWSDKLYPVVAVMADFHFSSIHNKITPLAFLNTRMNSNTVHASLAPDPALKGTWSAAIAKTEKLWKELYPEEDFNYEFYDKSIAKFYESEQNLSVLLKWATGLCILISVLGLLGLVVYTTNLRRREIGVRKVLGASLTQLVSLLSKDLMVLIGVAFLITVPLAWWSASNWLNDFAYRTEISWWIFAVSGAGMMLVAFFVLSLRIIKAALANPVESLRTE